MGSDDEGSGTIRKQPAPAAGGSWLAWLVLAGTLAFTVVTVGGIVMREMRGLAAAVDSVLFGLGVVGFVAAIVLSGARALEGVGVRASGLFLAGFAERREQLVFRASFAWTIVLGLGAALLVSGSSDPGPYVLTIPAMAYGILVPIFPPAMAGIHGARYCPWPMRG